MKIEEIIEELVAVILMQERELYELKEQNILMRQRIEVYEEYIKGE